MPKRTADIEALLSRSIDLHQRIAKEYQVSLDKRMIPADLRLDVKHMLESLRSVLDYLAHDIREAHCPSAGHEDRFYFPILSDRTAFDRRMSQWFPDLRTACPDLWDSYGLKTQAAT